MKKITLLATLVLNISLASAKCVHEKTLTGSELQQESTINQSIYVETQGAIFKPVSEIEINSDQLYKVQISHAEERTKSNGDYNARYIEYYDYPRLKKYLADSKQELSNSGYEIRNIGKSVKGRDLFVITPKVLKNKKTILMFGRHHGDEGTANWIIEGFLNEYLANKKFRDEFQLILYPMINPDGAQAKSRYNANGRDLNRSWNANSKGDLDEIKIVHGDLRSLMKKVGKDIFIALDMHGSFTKDFIYRVKRNYVSIDFYNQQQNFIDELGIYDPWQAGSFQLSNGDPGMARLVLINHYKKNALTHETVKNIPKRNSDGRSKKSLIDQGIAVLQTIRNIY